MAHEDDGSIWVADAANLRTLHLDSNSGKKNGALFLSAFPMFVPSLSWQNDRFYV
jgi:hypothetical protein